MKRSGGDSGRARRRLLKLLGSTALAAPLASAGLRRTLSGLLVGEVAAQQQAEPTFFVEVDLRNHYDLMHVMVPPSIAKYPDRHVGVNGEELSMFAPQGELKEYPNNVFLTNDSLELAPHIDTVAMLDTGEPGIGNVHGGEAGGGMRSPGRVMDGGASGLAPMFLIDGPTSGLNGAGSEQLYAAVPTPACFHNYYQRKLSPELTNGYTIKGVSFPKYNVYHFGAGLPKAELERFRVKEEFLQVYGEAYAKAGRPELELPVQAPLPYLKRGGAGEQSLQASFAALRALPPTLALSAEEEAYWSAGVPPQMCTEGDITVIECPPDDGSNPYAQATVKAQIWEQFAYAAKLMRAGVVRSVGIEWDYGHLDGDGARPEHVLREQAQQIARPLARFIEQMKAAGLYDRTIIAVYTVDGGRRPAANSYGNDAKGTCLLAGGRVKGGYYGDITIEGPSGTGHVYGLRTPDPATGALGPVVTTWGDLTKRTPSGSVWRTVAKALGIPESEYVGKFNALVDDAPPLDCMLSV